MNSSIEAASGQFNFEFKPDDEVSVETHYRFEADGPDAKWRLLGAASFAGVVRPNPEKSALYPDLKESNVTVLPHDGEDAHKAHKKSEGLATVDGEVKMHTFTNSSTVYLEREREWSQDHPANGAKILLRRLVVPYGVDVIGMQYDKQESAAVQQELEEVINAEQVAA